MTEPGNPAPDLAALFAATREIKSRMDQVQNSLNSIAASIQQHINEPRSSTRPMTRSSARGKDGESAVWTKAISGFKEACDKMDSLKTTAEILITSVSQLSQESRARADGSPVHGTLDQEGGVPVREARQQGETPTHTTEAGYDPPGRRSNDDALHGLTQFAGHAGRRQPIVDSSLPHLGSGSHEQAVPAGTEGHAAFDRSPQVNATASPEAISDAAQQPRLDPADGHGENSPRSSLPQDSGAAKQVGSAAAQESSTHQRRDADSDSDQAPANTHGDNSATRIETSRDPTNDGSGDDTPMQEAEDSLSAAALQGSTGQAGAADSRPDPSGEQEHESEDLAKRAAEGTAFKSPQAHEDKGGPEPIVANDQPAESRGLENHLGRRVGMSTPDGHTTTPLLITTPTGRGDTASSQVSTPSPSSGTTPQGSDTTEDTSRASTPDTHLTSPDTSVPGSTPKLTLSEADMGERLVEALGRIKRDDSMHKISAPNLPIDLDLLKANFSAPNHDCQYAANTFVPGPDGEGYTNVHISERRSDFAWPDFSEEVAIPTKEEARKWLNDFCDNPPENIVPYFSGHLHVPSHEHLLNPGPAILGNPKLADLHRPYWHIGGDRSANRFHIEDYNCSEDEWPCGLRSANLVLKGVKIWIGIKRHHTKEFEAFIARNWDCNGCSQRIGHQSLLIAPWRLEREGIDFVIEVQGPMELVDPGYGLYHGIVNMGSCIAMSMNYMLPGDCLKSTALRQCGDCGVPNDTVIHVPPHKQSTARKPLPSSPPHELSEPRMGLAARQATLPSAAPARRRPKKRGGGIWADAVPAEKKTKTGQGNDKETPRVTLESLQELGDKFKAMNLLYQVPTLQADQLPTERVFRLACAVSCRHAIQQFHSMVQSWNGRARLCEDVPLPGEDPISRIQYRVLLVDKYASMDTLYKYLLRQSQFGLVKEVEANRQGRMRADTSFVDKVLERTRWARQNYDYHYKRGKQWVAISDRIEGILPFLHYYPEPFNISPKQCPNLSEDELSSLASLLVNRPSKALLKAGVALQQAVEESQSVRFAWDRYEVDWNSLDENELISYLEVVDD